MKFNCKELAEYSNGEATIEGRLHHKRVSGGFSQSGFKEKWFKLRANVLFYFSATEPGKVFEKKPSGAFVLENAVVQYEMNSEVPFSFSILFHDDLEKKHLFAGRSEDNIDQWVNYLKQASYEFWRSQLMMLQTKICMLTGKDPLLMYPRNEGSSGTCSELRAESSMKGKKSTFKNYLNSEVDQPKDEGYQGFSKHSNTMFYNALEAIGTELNNVQIEPLPEPPRRPARGNRLRADNTSPNLIEL